MSTRKVMRRGVELDFTCSTCGYGGFGSYVPKGTLSQVPNNESSDEVLVRMCNGGCGTQFSIKDDYQYFTVNGKNVPSREEFEALVYEFREIPLLDVETPHPPVSSKLFVHTRQDIARRRAQEEGLRFGWKNQIWYGISEFLWYVGDESALRNNEIYVMPIERPSNLDSNEPL